MDVATAMGLASVRKGTSLVGILPRSSFQSEIRGAVPCTPVPQGHLAGTHSLHFLRFLKIP